MHLKLKEDEYLIFIYLSEILLTWRIINHTITITNETQLKLTFGTSQLNKFTYIQTPTTASVFNR